MFKDYVKFQTRLQKVIDGHDGRTKEMIKSLHERGFTDLTVKPGFKLEEHELTEETAFVKVYDYYDNSDFIKVNGITSVWHGYLRIDNSGEVIKHCALIETAITTPGDFHALKHFNFTNSFYTATKELGEELIQKALLKHQSVIEAEIEAQKTNLAIAESFKNNIEVTKRECGNCILYKNGTCLFKKMKVEKEQKACSKHNYEQRRAI